MSSSDINTSSQSLEIVLFLSDASPLDGPDAQPESPDEELTSSASTALALYTPVNDGQSVESSAPPSLLSAQGAAHDLESDITVPDGEPSDGGSTSDEDNDSSNGSSTSTSSILGAHLLALGLTPVLPGAHVLAGHPLLMPQEPGTVAPPGTPISGPISLPVGAGVDDLGSIIAQSAQLAQLAPPAGAGTPVSDYHAGTSSSAGSGTEESAEEPSPGPSPEPAGSATPGNSDGSSSESDDEAAEAPQGPPDSPVLAGVPHGPDAPDAVTAPPPPRKSNLNAASAPFVPSGTGSARQPPEPEDHAPSSQEGGAGNAGLDIYAAGPSGKGSALSALAPVFALGEAMAWEAACPHGVDEGRKAEVAASPIFQKHVGGNGVGGYGGGEGLVGVRGADGAGLGGQSAAGGCVQLAGAQPGIESGFDGSGPGQPVPVDHALSEESQPGHESGLDGSGDGGQHSAGRFVQRADGSYAVVEHSPEHQPDTEPEPAPRLTLSGDGRVLYRLAADGSYTAIGPTPSQYWLPEPEKQSEGESAQRLVLSEDGTVVYGLATDGSYAAIGPAPPQYWLPQPQPGPESQPEAEAEAEPEPQPEPEPEAEPEPEPEPEPESASVVERQAATERSLRRIRAELEVPTPPPGHHVAVVWGDEPDPVYRYIFLEDAPDDDEDDGGRDPRPGTPDGPGSGDGGGGEPVADAA